MIALAVNDNRVHPHDMMLIDVMARTIRGEYALRGLSMESGIERVFARADRMFEIDEMNIGKGRAHYGLVRACFGEFDLDGLPRFAISNKSMKHWFHLHFEMTPSTDAVFARAVFLAKMAFDKRGHKTLYKAG